MDPNTLKIIVLVLFVLTYISLMVFSKLRAYIAVAVAAIYVLIGAMPIGKVLPTVNWNVIMMIAGTMGTVYLFIESKMPALMADAIIDKMPNVKWAVISLALFAGIISAFVDNVATVLMVAPIAVVVAKKLKISPVPAVIAIAISSNLQGAATLVGDTTSILLGGYAGMDFLDFFWFQGKVGMFWIVQLGALVSTLVLMWYFRKDNARIHMTDRTVVTDFFPSWMLLGTVLLLIVASFFPNLPDEKNGYICLAIFAIGLVREYMRKKSLKPIVSALKEIDYFTLLLLAGLFVVIGTVTEVGIVDDIAKLIVRISREPFVIYTLICWSSVMLSAFIDNIPYIATMLPVVQAISADLGMDPNLFYFGLLVGATLGGNLTPIGASANIAGLGILRKEGHEVSPATFMKLSVPFTLAAVMTGYLLVWFIWR